MKNSSDSGENNSSDDLITTICPLCMLVVDRYSSESWKEVQGWVGGVKKDSMRLREDTGRFAHGECVLKLSQGQAVDQESLFDESEDPSPPSFSTGLPTPWEDADGA